MTAVRIISFITLLVLCTLVPWYILLLLGICYALYWQGALELLIVAFLIDGYFGAASHIPYYTLSTIALLFAIEWIKPRLVIYNEL